MKDIYISLGSNIGDRALNISRALEALPAHGVHLVQQSSPYETEPVELREQEWFLNGVVEVETNLSPQRLMQALLAIERSMGRLRLKPKGPRIIDMDILLFGSQIVREPGLEIPHPRMAERRFVLVPFAEIAAGAVHPVLQKTIGELLDETPDRSEVRLFL
ncbi:MAG: 2-amino-4-hydroxy-6-hydroxymethyldihydropteridine diphosphokinase [Candidatus Acidiferrales bacterium]